MTSGPSWPLLNDSSTLRAAQTRSAQLKSAHDDEIGHMHAHIEELESLLESESDSNRRLREDIQMKDEYIGDLYRQNEELLEAENEKQEFQENARREIQEYHDLRQVDLDKLQEQISTKKETLDAQEEALSKRKAKVRRRTKRWDF